ncbi:glycosyl hydrolase family 8 [Paenibacillus sp. GCM10023252]|uniref:glycosyl hydrolase family 8 n=1 Tax=Paenibacillus sp. GCM10023252 TaxID=3252649 RepID=UPI00360B0197
MKPRKTKLTKVSKWVACSIVTAVTLSTASYGIHTPSVSANTSAPASSSFLSGSEQYPFPHNVSYPHGIMPSLDRDTLNRDMLNLYTKWRDLYITTDGAKPGEVRIRSYDSNYKNGTCSEGMGFAMLISVYMANPSNSGRTDFDGLFRYYKRGLSPGYNFMGWKVDKDGNSIDPYSAPDGDLDVAVSLLMAHKQWGSDGEINYLEEAKTIITDIMEFLIYKPSYIVKQAQTTITSVISSYEIPGWFNLFGEITGDERWEKAEDAAYGMFNHFYNLNPSTGLVPYKWVLSSTGVPTYTGPNGPDSNSTSYGFDPCRLPWRVGQDFLWNGTSNNSLAHDFPDRNVKWFMTKINGNPATAAQSYNIDGTVRTASPSPRNMVGPMAVAAMVDSSNQASLDLMYNYLRTLEPTTDWPGGYYQDAVMMMSMLVLTGNMPNLYDYAPYPNNTLPAPLPVTDTTPPTQPLNVTVTNSTLNTIQISWSAATDNEGSVVYEIMKDGKLYNVTSALTNKLEYLDSGTAYTITVRARDKAGNVTSSQDIIGTTVTDTTAPPKTTGITAQAKSLTSITLRWTRPADDDAVNEIFYDIYMNDAKVNTERVYFPSDYVIKNLQPATAYNFKIVATDKGGNSSTSDVFTTSTTTTDTSKPSRPSYVRAASKTYDTVNLAWNASTDDNPSGTVTYDVYNGSQKVNTQPITGTSFTLTNLQPDTEYAIKVTARDSAGNTQDSYIYDTKTTDVTVSESLTGPGSIPSHQLLTTNYGMNAPVQRMIKSFSTTIKYDTAALQLVEAVSLQQGLTIEEINTSTPGELLIKASSTNGTVSTGSPLVKLTWQPKRVNQQVNLSSSTIAWSEQEKKLLTEGASLAVQVSYITEDISGPVSGQPDGKVDYHDVVFAKKHLNKTTNSPDWDAVRLADINNNGKIDLNDIKAIALKLAQTN